MPRRFLSRILRWLGAHESGVLITVAGMAAGMWIFAIIASLVSEGSLRGFDRRILLAFRHHSDLRPLGPRAIQEAARDITALGSNTLLGLVTIFSIGYFALAGKRRMAWYVCACVFGAAAFSLLLKDVFQRPRPDLVPHEVYAGSTSFPSGHSMMSAAVYLTLGALLARSHERRQMKAYFLATAVLLSSLVGVTRIYLGVHWPTDVLAGWAAGSAWALGCSLAARRLQNRGSLESQNRPENTKVPPN